MYLIYLRITISDLLARETVLCNTLGILKDAAQKAFFDMLKTRGEKLLRYPPQVAIDLSPPPAMREGISLLCEIIDTHNSMMFPASGKRPDFHPVISAFLNPIIQMCERAAEAHKSKGAIHSSRRNRMSSDPSQLRKSSSIDAILDNNSSIPLSQTNETPAKNFLVNCLCAIQQPLLRHDIASEYVKKVGEMIATHIQGLVEKEVERILKRCGLSNKMSYFRNSSNDVAISTEPLAELEDTAPASLSDGLKAFFGLVLGSENALPEFEQMQVPKLRSEVAVQVAKSLSEAYELIYNAVMDPSNRYPDPKSLARHPPDQIRTILGI